MVLMKEERRVQIRRDLHQIPEIGLKEFLTHNYLLTCINKLPQDRLEIETMDTAIIVLVKGTKGERTIAWRTDIDGLPIIEKVQSDYKSQHQGRMHACGHDFHMTIALGLIEEMISYELEDNLLFFFQPAEENESGAKIYYDNGFLSKYTIDEFYALHVHPGLPTGMIATSPKALCAGDCTFKITFTGTSGHAALPHQGNDMIIAATQFIQQAQTIVSRNINPMEGSVITFGEFHGGTADNIIAGEAVLKGTLRALSHEVNELGQRRLLDIATGIKHSFNCDVAVEMEQKGYIPVVNNPELAQSFIQYFKEDKTGSFKEVQADMTAEDFGYLLDKYAGVMFWLGVDSEFPLHHGQFNPDEAAISLGISRVTDWLLSRVN